MENRTRASIAMAVYNGEKYLSQQIDSILDMLSDEDELVISYDESKDSTYRIISEYERNNSQVHVYENKFKKGVSGNFTNAAMHCKGQYILFSDQDDVWLGDKINAMVKTIKESGADLVIHYGYLTDENPKRNPKTLHQLNNASTKPLKNFIKGRFLGCCMAFKKDTMRYVLPFPDVTSDFPHDIFATILVGLKGKIVIVPDIYIMHRLHDGNETPKTRNPLPVIAYKRMILLFEIIKRIARRQDFNYND